MMKTDILVITALALEFKAVEHLLAQSESVKHPATGARYKRGIFAGGKRNFAVAVVEAGAGNVNAAQETERALTFFQPDYIFFVGVAGGIKDVTIGDVVVSTEVIHYEGGKAGDVYKPRLTTHPASYELVSLARLIARDESWQHRTTGGSENNKAEVKPIAAGEKVVASEYSAVYELLTQSVSQALAVEMEGYGFLAPIYSHHAKGIVIRGVSDLLKNKEAADASGSQPKAARNAAAFLAAMLEELADEKKQVENGVHVASVNLIPQSVIEPILTNPLDNLEWRNQLAKTLAELYEAGPNENGGAWKRAGGRVTFLNNSSSTQTQWFAAIDRLAKGGSGDITLESLLSAVQEDYKNNSVINNFIRDLKGKK